MGRRRKDCSAQPYLDYIGVSERERKEMKKKNKVELPKLRGLKVDEIISKYPSAIRIMLRELLLRLEKFEVDNDWLPTPENINVLPEPVRKFIHDLETNTDPAHIVRENILIKDTCRLLVIKLEEKKVTKEWIEEKAVDTANDYPDIAFPNLIAIFKKLLKEAGMKVVKK